MNILHLTAHLGAGAGKAIAGLAIADRSNRHAIAIVEKPQKTNHIDRAISQGVPVYICPDDKGIAKLVRDADVVIINWWHNPEMYRVLSQISTIPCRLVLWSHLNGLRYPIMNYDFLQWFDFYLFTSRASLENTLWTNDQRKQLLQRSEVVLGMGDFDPYKIEAKEDYVLNRPVSIGYVGSLDYAKMHPEYIAWCENALQDVDAVLKLYGDALEPIKRDVEKSPIRERIKLCGFCDDIPDVLRNIDLFVYILNPQNFATTENSILEAMAAALPIIVSDGAAEKAIIDDRVNGIIVSSKETLKTAIRELLDNDDLRTALGTEARKKVMEKYTVTENITRLDQALNKICHMKKKTHDLSNVSGYHWFISGCAPKDQEFFRILAKTKEPDGQTVEKIQKLKTIFTGKTKGSVFQFAETFPDDKDLMRICKALRKVGEKYES